MGVQLFGALNRIDTDTVTVSIPAATNFPIANLNDDRPYTAYRMNTTSSPLDIKTNSGSAVVVNYFMLAGHDLSDPNKDGLGACTLLFEFSDDDFSSSTTIFSVTPTDNKMIARAFVLAAGHKDYRIRITRGTDFVANLGELAWGQGVRTPFNTEVGFDPEAETITARFNQTQVGNIVGAVSHFTQRRARVELRLISSTFVDGNTLGDFREFWENHARKILPFLFMWNAGADAAAASDTTHEFQAMFGPIDPGAGIERPIVTPVDKGFRDLRFTITALAETC